jgi:hypothetical protein
MTDLGIDGLELQIAYESIAVLSLVTSIPIVIVERGLLPL